MKRKQLILTGMALAGLGVLAFGSKRVVEENRKTQKQEEMLCEIRDYFSRWGKIATVYVDLPQSSKDTLVGGCILEDARQFSFTYSKDELLYEEMR